MILQHSLLTYCIPLVKDQSSFYEMRSLSISIKIKAFNRVNRKQPNILKTFLEYLEFYIVAYWRWFSPKSYLTNNVLRASCLYPAAAYQKVQLIKKFIFSLKIQVCVTYLFNICKHLERSDGISCSTYLRKKMQINVMWKENYSYFIWYIIILILYWLDIWVSAKWI